MKLAGKITTVAALLLASWVGVAQAQYPGANGIIAYSWAPNAPASSSLDIYAVNPDGTNPTCLSRRIRRSRASTSNRPSPRPARGSGLAGAAMVAR